MKRTRKNNSRADWREARQMPHQRHPQGLGAEGRRPSQHNQLTQYRRGIGGGIDEPAGSPEGSESRVGDGDQFDGSSDNVVYDKAGNATSMKPDKTGDWSEYYQLKWDGWNRLVEVKDSASAVVATYAYDGTTRRITKTIGAVVTHFYYNDQWKPVEERKDSSTDANRQYAWGIQFRNDLILRDRDTTGNGTLDERLYATHDALGNCTAILNTSGAVQERYGYSAFGVRRIMQANFTDRASSSFAWDFGFQGEFIDDETGYINYGYRYYLPYVGKWLSRDPIAEDGGNNLYLFVRNDGVNKRDYLGRELSGWDVTGYVIDIIPVVGTFKNLFWRANGSKVSDYSIDLDPDECRNSPDLAELKCIQSITSQATTFEVLAVGAMTAHDLVDVGVGLYFSSTLVVPVAAAVDGAIDTMATLYDIGKIADKAREAQELCVCPDC